MAIQTLEGFWLPELPNSAQFSSGALRLDANGEKSAFVFQAPKTGTLDKAEFRLGTATFGGSSVLRVSFQNINMSDGNPDGTQDQYRDMTSLTANAWNTPGLMTDDGTDTGAKRSVTRGDLLAVVWEYATFTAGDDVQVALSVRSAEPDHDLGYVTQFTASWSKIASRYAHVALKYSDGTYATPVGAFPASDINTTTYNSGSTPDERGLRFQLPFPASLAGFAAQIDLDGAADVVLYDAAGSAIAGGSVSMDPDVRGSTALTRKSRIFASSIELEADTTYYLLVKPTSVTDIILADFDVASAGIMSGFRPGTEWYYAHRTDGGSITTTTTKRPYMQLMLDGFDDGAGGGGLPVFGGAIVR